MDARNLSDPVKDSTSTSWRNIHLIHYLQTGTLAEVKNLGKYREFFFPHKWTQNYWRGLISEN